MKKEEVKKEEKVDELKEGEEEEVHPFLPTYDGDPKVVFLQHGLMGSSDNWNTNTQENSLGRLRPSLVYLLITNPPYPESMLSPR